MERLVILSQGSVKGEVQLGQTQIDIGRDPGCDVALDDPSISRRHASITRVSSEFYVEDLGSTNGTLLNGRKVQKHVLKDGDLVTVGRHVLRFEQPAAEPEQQPDPDRTMVISASERSKLAAVGTEGKKAPSEASVRYLSGPKAGTSDKVGKTLLSLGRPGEQVAAVVRRPKGFFLVVVSGNAPLINGKPMQGSSSMLEDDDLIEVGDTRVRINLKQAD